MRNIIRFMLLALTLTLANPAALLAQTQHQANEAYHREHMARVHRHHVLMARRHRHHRHHRHRRHHVTYRHHMR